MSYFRFGFLKIFYYRIDKIVCINQNNTIVEGLFLRNMDMMLSDFIRLKSLVIRTVTFLLIKFPLNRSSFPIFLFFVQTVYLVKLLYEPRGNKKKTKPKNLESFYFLVNKKSSILGRVVNF